MARIPRLLVNNLGWSDIAVAGMGFVVGYQLMEAAWWALGEMGWGIVTSCAGVGLVVSLLALKWRAKVGSVAVGLGTFILLLNVAAWVVLEFGWATRVGTGWLVASVVLALLVAVAFAFAVEQAPNSDTRESVPRP